MSKRFLSITVSLSSCYSPAFPAPVCTQQNFRNWDRCYFPQGQTRTGPLLGSYYYFQAIALVMSNWPCSKMAWAPYGRGGVEGVSSSSQKVFGSGQLERNSAAKESSCCPPPPALCYAQWRPLDLRTERGYVNYETWQKIFTLVKGEVYNWIAKNNVSKLPRPQITPLSLSYSLSWYKTKYFNTINFYWILIDRISKKYTFHL